MPTPAPFQQWERLAEHYRALDDEHLLALHSKLDDFNDEAQHAIRKELQHRNLDPLPIPPLPKSKPTLESETEPSGALLADNRWQVLYLAGVVACDCLTEEQLTLCSELLDEAHLDFVVRRPREFDALRYPQLLVSPEDLSRAKEVLKGPITEELRRQAELSMAVEDFPTILCPNCSAPDPLLESVDPTNQWLCESCEHRWSDPDLAPENSV
jgi:hypothetical protein